MPMFERNTIVSSHVLNLINESNHPLSVSEIMTQLEIQGYTPNKTTVYRILNKLVDKKVATKFSVRNGVSYFEVSQDHHHHFICNECETAFCLGGCPFESNLINYNRLFPNKKFKVKYHEFNLYGTCEPCVNKKEK